MGDLLGWCSWWPYHAPDRGGKKDVLRVALTQEYVQFWGNFSSKNINRVKLHGFIFTIAVK
jgi:hypothetical protein